VSATVRYSPEAEESVIGVALVHSSAVPQLVADLAPADFYTPALGRIFAAMVDLYQGGFHIDAVTVTDHLRSTGQLDEAGTPSLLLHCMNRYDSVHHVGSYVAAVRREAMARSLAVMAGEVRKGLDDSADPQAIAEKAEEHLNGLSRAGQLPGCYWETAEGFETADHAETLTPLAEGFCYPLSRIMVVAGEKGGKSLLLRQIAFCLAAGIHPFNPKISIPPVRTLLFDAENDVDELVPTMERIRSGVAYWAGTDAAQPGLYSVPYGTNLASRRDRGDLYAVLEHFRPQLIVGGPVYKLTDQTEDLSEDRRAAVVMSVFNDVRKRWGSAVILEHHAPTGSGRGRDMRAKGGQVWAAWVNMTVALHPTQDGASVDVRYPHPPRGHYRWPKRFDRGLNQTDWPWVPVMRQPVVDVAPPLDEPLPADPERFLSEPF
jgi:replicative DNA helicase